MRSTRVVGIVTAALVTAIALVPAGPEAYSAPNLSSAPTSATAFLSGGDHEGSQPRPHRGVLGQYKRIVVIYQENHSFDNLFGAWGSVDRERVEGLAQADPAHTTQVAQDLKPFKCLPQNDVNLKSPPLAADCVDAVRGITSAFENQPFTMTTTSPHPTTPAPPKACPHPLVCSRPTGALTGGCTRDLVHKFYQEKYQIHGGKQDRYVTGSDAIGLTMGTYDTKQLPIYGYLHRPGAPNYVIADRFFQGANGGSFLNHQWLITGRAPYADNIGAIPDASRPLNSIIDSNGMPAKYEQYIPDRTVVDGQLTVACDDGNTKNYRLACGNFAVNTVQPASSPRGGGRFIPLIDDTKYPNIGDRLTSKGISWAWYSGGWDAAEAGTPGKLFQYHHQPFNYFAAYAPGQPGRHHLQDESDFLDAATIGNLPTRSASSSLTVPRTSIPAMPVLLAAASIWSTWSTPWSTGPRPKTP